MQPRIFDLDVIAPAGEKTRREGASMQLKHLTWDYKQPLEDELWRARRLAEFFPFVLESLTAEDKRLLLSKLDELNLPAERKEFIRMVCHE